MRRPVLVASTENGKFRRRWLLAKGLLLRPYN